MSILQKIQGLLAILLLVAMLLPWFSSGGTSISGYEVGVLTGSADAFPEDFDARSVGVGASVFNYFYVIPVLALVLIALCALGRETGTVSFLTGLYVVVVFLAWGGRFQTHPGQVLAVGGILAWSAGGLMMIVAAVFRREVFLVFVDRLSMWMGKTFGWCILILTFGLSYEVFMRYLLSAPTAWAYDLSYMMYGALFLMAGAYTVSRDGHVRGDVVYRLWPPRVQAGIDLTLFLTFYFPGVTALIYSGFIYARQSFMFQESSVFSPAGMPIYQLKALIPIAGVVLFLQGISEVVRCVRCLRTGQWPPRYHDVEELESALQHFEEDTRRSGRGEAPAGGAER